MDNDFLDTAGERMEEQELLHVWGAYVADRDGRSDLRDRLVGHYFYCVRDTAERMIRSLSSCVDVQDLVCAGSVGLLEAVQRFEPGRDVMFETFSRPRIRGAILDDFRRNDPVPRTIRNAATRISHTRSELEVALGRLPSDEEMADAFRMGADEFAKFQQDAHIHAFVPLERAGSGEENGRRELDPIEMIPDARVVNPLESLIREEIRQRALRGLDECERQVLILLYDRELNLKEIGKILDLSESRICQIKKKAKDFLRAKYKEITAELADVVG